MGAAEAAARARGPQPLWALVPAPARARYLRRAAMALLDELEPLAELLAEEAGQPRTEALLAELLPAAGGLNALADDGPAALRDRRLGRIPALRAGRRSTLVQAPAGIVGIRARPEAPFADPALEVAASLLAGNGVVLAPSAPRAAARLLAAYERAGIPQALVGLVDPETPHQELSAACDRIVGGEPPGPKGTMLVLDGAPVDRVVSGALWAAFAYSGRHPAALGRVVVVPSVAERLIADLTSAARRLRVGDPQRPDTEVGPLRSAADADAVSAAVDEAVGEGATVLCGGPVTIAGHPGPFVTPVVLRGVPDGASVLRRRLPGPVLAVVEASSEADAVELATQAGGAVSVWSGDRAKGERVARTLPAEVTWVNEHGFGVPDAPVRLARHVAPRRLASQPTRLRSARWLPYDPALVRASEASARLLAGRESERLAALRRGAWPLARTAVRLAREAVSR